MSECYIEKISPVEFIGDTLPVINNNFINLQNIACNLSSTLVDIPSLGVTSVSGTINLDVSSLGSGEYLLQQVTTPQWHIGLTNKLLHLESLANRVSQQINNEDYLQETIDRTQKHNPIYLKPITRAVSTPNVFW